MGLDTREEERGRGVLWLQLKKKKRCALALPKKKKVCSGYSGRAWHGRPGDGLGTTVARMRCVLRGRMSCDGMSCSSAWRQAVEVCRATWSIPVIRALLSVLSTVVIACPLRG